MFRINKSHLGTAADDELIEVRARHQLGHQVVDCVQTTLCSLRRQRHYKL